MKNISGNRSYKHGKAKDRERSLVELQCVYLHIVNVSRYIEHIVFYILKSFFNSLLQDNVVSSVYINTSKNEEHFTYIYIL